MRGIGEHHLKRIQPDKVIKSQNCETDGFCAAHGNDPMGSK